jgi:hypothetical protein
LWFSLLRIPHFEYKKEKKDKEKKRKKKGEKIVLRSCLRNRKHTLFTRISAHETHTHLLFNNPYSSASPQQDREKGEGRRSRNT